MKVHLSARALAVRAGAAHIGTVAPVEYNLKDQAPGRAASAAEPRLASSWHVGGRPTGSPRCLSVAVFSIQ